MRTNGIALLFAALLAGCSSGNLAGGSSTTVGNPVVIGTASADGSPLVNAKVYILDTGEIPVRTDTLKPLFTDKNGRFSMVHPAGVYRISMIDSEGKVGCISDIQISGDTAEAVLEGRQFGAVSVKNSSAVLTVPGTPFRSAGTLAVPAGTIPSLRILDSSGTSVSVAENIQVEPGQTTETFDHFVWYTLCPLPEKSVQFAAKAADGKLFFAGKSAMYSSVYTNLTVKEYPGTQITGAAECDGAYWISSDSGLYKQLSGFEHFTPAVSPLSTALVTALGRDGGRAVAAAGSSIYTTDGKSWDSVSVPAGLRGTVSAAGSWGSMKCLGTSQGEIRLYDGSVWKNPAELNTIFAGRSILYLEYLNDSLLCAASSNGAVLWNLRGEAAEDRLMLEFGIRSVYADRRSGSVWILFDGGVTRRSSSGTISSILSSKAPIIEGASALGTSASADEVLLIGTSLFSLSYR